MLITALYWICIRIAVDREAVLVAWPQHCYYLSGYKKGLHQTLICQATQEVKMNLPWLSDQLRGWLALNGDYNPTSRAVGSRVVKATAP